MSVSSAIDFCSNQGADFGLAVLDTNTAFNGLVQQLSHDLDSGKHFWVGASRDHTNGVYVWSDETTVP
nr:hypothetical protein BaRGS_028561 [Batillaria attramentaria]